MGTNAWTTGEMPGVGPPSLPPQMGPFAKPRGGRKVTALVVTLVVVAGAVFAFSFLGSKAGASDLKVVFTPGETHTYSLEVTMRGRGGNLDGGFSTDLSVAAEMTQQTGAVDKDGNATITYTLKNFHVSKDGRPATPPPGAGLAFTVRMRPDGTVVGVDGGDPLGLEKINPAGQFVNPGNAGPLLPKRKVTPGQSWTVEMTQTLPDLGTLHAKAENTLVERKNINGNDATVIHSVVSVPLNIHLGHDELARQAKNTGQPANAIPGSASISMLGNMRFNLTQTIFTANGLLQSVLGDGAMTGTMTIGGIPSSGTQSVVFDLDFEITIQKTSTGQAA